MSERQDNSTPKTPAPEGGRAKHPVGTVVGMIGGARAGMALGSLFGSIGKLVGAAAGAVVGSGAGKAIAETINPKTEEEYWRQAALQEIEFGPGYEFDRDYLPAYRMGWQARNEQGARDWDDDLERELRSQWDEVGSQSQLDWDRARKPVQDAWERTSRTHEAYEAVDRHFESRLDEADYFERDGDLSYADYRPAYRFGTYARSLDLDAGWDAVEEGLATDWARERGDSKLSWEQARPAVREAWENAEVILQRDDTGRLVSS